MKFKIKNDWNNLPSGQYIPSPYFTGRINEINQLIHLIKYKNSGSILISAPRGTGKTDLVYQSLINSDLENNNIVPVIFNASNIDSKYTKNESKDFELDVLKFIISRTFSQLKDRKLNRRIKDRLYRIYLQSTSSNFQEIKKLSIENKELSEDLAIKKYKVIGILKVDFENLVSLLKYTLPTISTVSGVIFNIFKLFDDTVSIALIVIGILLYFIFHTIGINLTSEGELSGEHTNNKSKKLQDSAELSFLTDNSFNTLESEFRELLNMLSSNNPAYKLVFVIDELDKLQVRGQEVLELIKKFKGLFNHSDAIFFFIVDETVYQAIEASRKDRIPSSTLFSDWMYIPRASISDIKEYITKIIIPPVPSSINVFSDVILYESKMDFYRIGEVIKDYVKYKENEIEIEFENDDNWKNKANKQNIINLLLEEGKYLYTRPSNIYLNEELINEVYNICNSESPIEMYAKPSEIPSIQSQKVLYQLKSDLCKYLAVAGIFIKKPGINDKNEQVIIYTPTSNPGRRLKSLDELLEFEQDYIQNFDIYKGILLHIYNIWSKCMGNTTISDLNDSAINELKRLHDVELPNFDFTYNIYKKYLEDPKDHPFTQEETAGHIESVKKGIYEVINTYSLRVIINIIKDFTQYPTYDLLQHPQFLGSIADLNSFIISNNIPAIAIQHPDTAKIGLIILNNLDSIQNNESILKEVESANIYILEYLTGEEQAIMDKRKNILSQGFNNYSGLQSFDLKALVKKLDKK